MLFEMLKLQIRGITIPYCARKKREREKKEKDIEKDLINLKEELDMHGKAETQQKYNEKQVS